MRTALHRRLAATALFASALVCTALTASDALAALPPYWQRLRELQAILDSSDVARALETRGPIDAVALVGPDRYRVTAGGCTLDVAIVDDPPPGDGWVGPRQFHLKVGAAACP